MPETFIRQGDSLVCSECGRATSLLRRPPLLHKYNCSAVFDCLTAREKTVCQLLVHGMTAKQVGTELNISYKTVETHRNAIHHKLGLRTNSDMIRFLMETEFARRDRETAAQSAPRLAPSPGLAQVIPIS